MTLLDPPAADNVHYATDPRIRHLAEAAGQEAIPASRPGRLRTTPARSPRRCGAAMKPASCARC